MPDLLFEIGTEELPAAYIPPALDQLKAGAQAALKGAGLDFRSALATGTPRRLVLFVEELPVAQAARTEETAGPPERVAFEDGRPTRAARAFAEKSGVRVEDLVVKDTPRGRYVFALKRIEGRHTAALLLELLPALVRGISFPKSMRWPQSRDPFARPIRRLLCLFGREVVPVEVAGVRAGRTTVGHPFLSGPRELALERADYGAYRALLKGHGVIVDRNERRSEIQIALEQVFAKHDAPFRDWALLEEVTDLVEAPRVMEGGFDERYLQLPPEVVEAAMTDHQRYFPIVTRAGKIVPRFAFVANRPGADGDVIREGNERVLRARLEDASFYLHEDLKRSLRARAGALSGIVFQEKLGSMAEKTERLVALAGAVAAAAGLSRADAEAARKAAEIAKADLTTELVKEFPQLQGAVGAQYAALQGEGEAVARAIAEHYLPRFAGDELPRTAPGAALALAEKLDNLCGFFSIGLAPSGSADPYSLRRQAAGAVRIVLDRKWRLSLGALLLRAAAPFERRAAPAATAGAVGEFLRDRFRGALVEAGYRYDLIDAVLAAGHDDLVDAKERLDAVAALARTPAFPALVELVERTHNIARALAEPRPVREDLLRAPEEKALFDSWRAARPEVEAAIAARDWAGAARAYHDRLAGPVHTFFEKVFVNVEDPDVRTNRLSLLREINRAFAGRVADLSKVVEGKK